MRYHRAARSITKWCATAAALLIAGTWTESLWWETGVWWNAPWPQSGNVIAYPGFTTLLIKNGYIEHFKSMNDGWPAPDGPTFYARKQHDANVRWVLYEHLGFGHAIHTFVALWPLCLLAAVPACLLWGGDIIAHRRLRVGSCRKCGYSRVGLEPVIKCPECGTAPAHA